MSPSHIQASERRQRRNADRGSVVIPLIMRRECRTVLLKKAVIVTFLLSLLLVLGSVLAASFMKHKDAPTNGDKPVSVIGIVGHQIPVAQPYWKEHLLDFRKLPAEKTPESALDDKTVDAVMIPDGTNHWILLADSLNTSLADKIIDGYKDTVIADAVRQQGGNPVRVDQARARADDAVTLKEAGTFNENTSIRVLVAAAGVMILFFAVLLFGGITASSVVEEKQSRVVEVILSTTRPLHLLAGKILGTGAIAIVYTALTVAVGVATAVASGLVSLSLIPFGGIGFILVALILGYLFFTSLFALSGALVSRTEDLGNANLPITLLAIATVYVSSFGFSHLDSTFMRWMAWIPPFNIGAAPLEYAAGNMPWWMVVASMAVLALATVGVIVLVAAVYPRVILRMGARVPLREAFRRS